MPSLSLSHSLAGPGCQARAQVAARRGPTPSRTSESRQPVACETVAAGTRRSGDWTMGCTGTPPLCSHGSNRGPLAPRQALACPDMSPPAGGDRRTASESAVQFSLTRATGMSRRPVQRRRAGDLFNPLARRRGCRLGGGGTAAAAAADPPGPGSAWAFPLSDDRDARRAVRAAARALRSAAAAAAALEAAKSMAATAAARSVAAAIAALAAAAALRGPMGWAPAERAERVSARRARRARSTGSSRAQLASVSSCQCRTRSEGSDGGRSGRGLQAARPQTARAEFE